MYVFILLKGQFDPIIAGVYSTLIDAKNAGKFFINENPNIGLSIDIWKIGAKKSNGYWYYDNKRKEWRK